MTPIRSMMLIAALVSTLACAALSKILNANANDCVSFNPPVSVSGVSCSQLCVTTGADGIGVKWTCTNAATGAAMVVKGN